MQDSIQQLWPTRSAAGCSRALRALPRLQPFHDSALHVITDNPCG